MNLDMAENLKIEIAPAGVYQLAAGSTGQVWGAGLSGLYRLRDDTWQPVLPGAAFLQSRAVLAAGKLLLVAGLAGGVVFSTDEGVNWNSSWVEQTNAPVNCFAASPNFDEDGAMLAGLEGDGILRAESGGRFWRLSNFGLRNFSVYALAVIPPWGRREVVLAGTADGLYRSPNGGRAWRFCGLAGQVVLSLAVGAAADGILLAGTESGGLFRSTDGGEQWAPAVFDGRSDRTINALCSAGGLTFLAGADDGLWRSLDGGITWAKLAGSPEAVLSVIRHPHQNRLLITTADQKV